MKLTVALVSLSVFTRIQMPLSSWLKGRFAEVLGCRVRVLKGVQVLLPALSISNVNVTGCDPMFLTQPQRSFQPENRKGSEGCPAWTSSFSQTAPAAVAGPNSSGLLREVNHKFELDCPGPVMPPFAFRLFRNSFCAESSHPNTN